jgi:putative ABC transport system substrate-binding protein
VALAGASMLHQAAWAQAGPGHRVGMLFATGPLPEHAGFDEGMRALGYGRDLVVERRYAEGRLERLRELAAELVRLKVDAIVTSSTPAALAARDATASIAIVLAIAGDALGAGLVTNLAHPGGNITGLSFFAPEVIAKSLEFLKQAVPGATRVAFVGGSAFPPELLAYRRLQAIAPGMGVRIELADISAATGAKPMFASLAANLPDALVVSQAAFGVHAERVLELARHRPAAFGSREGAEHGGLLAYGPNRRELFQRAASYVDKILKGAKPGDLPIEQPTRFELIVNLKAAKALGITIPQSLLLRADEVIQ